ncbi:MAG: transglutaminase-like cysteine peptidase [Desulfobulbaceae bacterium]|nr:transglutaminase-like cysteine peptidase [Desulfobulbaceae bacterium]
MALVLLLMSGCGVKKKAPEISAVSPEISVSPEEVVKLDSRQQGIVDWYVLMREKSNVSEMEKLESVNRFFNQLAFVDDLSHWGKADYWATPQEMLVTNGGDCEDFAFAKYFTLLHLDIVDEKMRLTYVKSLTRRQPHMVLNYYAEPTAEPLILDSLVKVISPASERPDLIPIYSFNGRGLWLAKKQSSDLLLGGSERLNLWVELKFRFNQKAIAAPLPK